MKLTGKYVLQEIAGKGVLTPASVRDASAKSDSGVLQAITLSGSAYWMLKNFDTQEFTLDEAVDAVCEHYDVPRETALSDISSLIEALRSYGALND